MLGIGVAESRGRSDCSASRRVLSTSSAYSPTNSRTPHTVGPDPPPRTLARVRTSTAPVLTMPNTMSA